MEALARGELVPDKVAQAVRYGDSGLVRAAPLGDLAVLCAEVASPRPGCGPGRFDKGAPQPVVAWGDPNSATLARRFVIAGADAGPLRQVPRTGEPAHVSACFGDHVVEDAAGGDSVVRAEVPGERLGQFGDLRPQLAFGQVG